MKPRRRSVSDCNEDESLKLNITSSSDGVGDGGRPPQEREDYFGVVQGHIAFQSHKSTMEKNKATVVDNSNNQQRPTSPIPPPAYSLIEQVFPFFSKSKLKRRNSNIFTPDIEVEEKERIPKPYYSTQTSSTTSELHRSNDQQITPTNRHYKQDQVKNVSLDQEVGASQYSPASNKANVIVPHNNISQECGSSPMNRSQVESAGLKRKGDNSSTSQEHVDHDIPRPTEKQKETVETQHVLADKSHTSWYNTLHQGLMDYFATSDDEPNRTSSTKLLPIIGVGTMTFFVVTFCISIIVMVMVQTHPSQELDNPHQMVRS